MEIKISFGHQFYIMTFQPLISMDEFAYYQRMLFGRFLEDFESLNNNLLF